MTERYPFGLVPTDPFDLARCPRCRNEVGPGAQHCASCFATYDLAAARAAVLASPEIASARFASLALAPVAAVGGTAAYWLGGWVSPWVVPACAAILVFGLAGWATFRAAPRLASVIVALQWLVLAGGALWGQLLVLGVGSLGVIRLAPLVVVALCAYMLLECWRGFTRGAVLAKLAQIPRPEPREETYR